MRSNKCTHYTDTHMNISKISHNDTNATNQYLLQTLFMHCLRLSTSESRKKKHKKKIRVDKIYSNPECK